MTLQEAPSTSENLSPFSPECRLVFGIPLRDDENDLERSLTAYERLDSEQLKQIEVQILLNSLEGESAHKKVEGIIKRHPHLKVSLKIHSYPAETTLTQVRHDLFKVIESRAKLSSQEPLIVSHDADLLEISGDYVSQLLEQFDRDPDLDMVAGFVDYPTKDFHQDHLFFAIQLFEDILEEKIREKTGQVVAHGGNTAFRLNALSKPGFGQAFQANNMPLYLQSGGKQEGIKMVVDDEVMSITSSARRQMSALGARPPVLLANRYHQEIEFVLSESAHKVTSDDFVTNLKEQLSSIYTELIKNRPCDLTVGELSQIFLLTGAEIGLDLELSVSDVNVKNANLLKERILADFSSY